jgi:PKD repeat protein
VIPSAPVAGRDIQFDASASSGGQDRDTTGTIVSYEWDFGDASAGTSATTTHVFAAGGVFVVKLTVTNDAGQSDTAQQTLEVAPPPPPYDPGGGAGGGGINPSSVSPMSVQSLVTSSSIAGTVKLGVAVSFELPAGSKAGACSGDGSVLVSSGSLHKVSGKAAAAASGSSCQLRFKVSLPKGYAGKKAKFAFAFAGNQSVAPWATTRKLLVK